MHIKEYLNRSPLCKWSITSSQMRLNDTNIHQYVLKREVTYAYNFWQRCSFQSPSLSLEVRLADTVSALADTVSALPFTTEFQVKPGDHLGIAPC